MWRTIGSTFQSLATLRNPEHFRLWLRATQSWKCKTFMICQEITACHLRTELEDLETKPSRPCLTCSETIPWWIVSFGAVTAVTKKS
jgi:hypothetical protein